MVQATKTGVRSFFLENLLLNSENPRHEPVTNQVDAIRTIAQSQGRKLVNLAKDIVENGLNPMELIMVIPTEQNNRVVVVEGNRRVAALKLLGNPDLLASLELSKPRTKQYKDLQEQTQDSLPQEIMCAVVSPEDAEHWMMLKHTGENEGAGVVPWTTVSRDRFRGGSPALQALATVEKHGYITEQMKAEHPNIPITNVSRFLITPDVSRFLITPEARQMIGVVVEDNTVAFDSEEAVGRLALLVQDVLTRRINVNRLRTKEDRVSYAQELLSRELPSVASQETGGKQEGKRQEQKKGQVIPKRTTLAPKNLKLAISRTRIAKIYDELRKLDVSKFTNAAAVLLRVFVEMSVDDYAAQKEISLKEKKGDRDFNLRKKIITLTNYMRDHNLRDRSQLHGIRAIANNKDHVLSIDSWHAYIHNQHYNPIPSELVINWDNIQPFIEEIWKE